MYSISISLDNTTSCEVADVFVFSDIKTFILDMLIEYPTARLVVNDGTGAHWIFYSDVVLSETHALLASNYSLLTLQNIDTEFTRAKEYFKTRTRSWWNDRQLFYTYFDIPPNAADSTRNDWHGFVIESDQNMTPFNDYDDLTIQMCESIKKWDVDACSGTRTIYDKLLAEIQITKRANRYRISYDRKVVGVSRFLTEAIYIACLYHLELLFKSSMITLEQYSFNEEQQQRMQLVRPFDNMFLLTVPIPFQTYDTVHWRVMRDMLSGLTRYVR